MAVESRTSVFYGDLVEAAMDKDIKRMVELIGTLSDKEIRRLEIALIKINVVSNSITAVRINAS